MAASDTYLAEYEHFERVYQRRKSRFHALQQRQDVSTDRLFIISDQRPWQVFQDGYISEKLQRRKLVFERSQTFPMLHEACVSGGREQVRDLLHSAGVCVFERDASGRIALHHAVITEHVKIAKKLLRRRDAKLQLHVRDNSGRTALHYALGKMELLALHRREGSRVPALVTVEMRAESKRYRRLWELADRMLEMFNRRVLEDGDWTIGGGCRDSESLEVLDIRCRGDAWDACRSGDVERLERIVKVYCCSTEEWELSELKRTLLHEACENQQLQVVNFILSTMEISVLAQDASGCTALHCAARRGLLDVCQLLLGRAPGDSGEQSAGSNDSAEQLVLIQDVRGRTALHWSLLGSSDPLARVQTGTLLSQTCPAALHICDHDGVFPLHLAIWRGSLELVRQFISLGANVCGSSPSSHPLHREEYPDKAAWAPCGIVFQRQRVRRLKKVAPITASPGDNSSALCKMDGPDWDSVQHPVETLWYWTRQRRTSNSGDNTIVLETEEALGGEAVLSDDELGCRKYGGRCDYCKIMATGNARASNSARSAGQSQLSSPLLLAIRVCALKWDNCSLSVHRVAIVKILLRNGAKPDEPASDECDDTDATGRNERASPSSLSALIEGLRVFPRYPQLLSMLLQHGAEQIAIADIERWCSSQYSSDTTQAEAALSLLLELDHVASSSDFLLLLFVRKYFRTLDELLKLWPQMTHTHASEMDAASANDDNCACLTRGSTWKCIHESLLSWRKRRRKPGDERVIDIEHLKALHERIAVSQGAEGEGVEVHELIEYCFDQYLQQRSSPRTPREDVAAIKSPANGELILLLCIRSLFKHWNNSEGGDERAKSKAIAWLHSLTLLGYFECALVLVEMLSRLGGRYRLLDTVFKFYASAIDARRHPERSIPCHQREFIAICTEKLLTTKSTTTDRDQPQSDDVASVRALVHMCASNYPLDLIQSCYSIVAPDGIALDAMKTMRVGGKTMVQWVVLHARVDLMEWLLVTIPEGLERGSYWSYFVAVSVTSFSGSEEKGKTSYSFSDKLFSAYQELVQPHLSISERTDLLLTLMIKHAIPNDCVELTARIVAALRTMDDSSRDASDAENITRALKECRILHTTARWGAIRIAEYFLSDECSSYEAGTNDVKWHQIFIDQIQERHELDECTPLELCRLLGHNHLFSLLSTRVPQASSASTKNNASTAEVGSDESEPAADSEKEEESTVQWQVGVLRTILEVNEKRIGQHPTQGEVSSGYRRWSNFKNDWASAVALNQVSHLQAMALTRPHSTDQDSSVHTSIITAIKNASLEALTWILETNCPTTDQLTDAESLECIYTAAKHPGDVYAKMALLLLENHFNPGRLSGDGMGTPLLHRAACFSNTPLACRIMTMLLERSDCDVNALDAFGNTAVSYALAAGRLDNACFLIQHLACRLEAEYEGQACFYYVLHLLPSFAPRLIIRELLMAKRERAFLHCDADSKTCGCKSYELLQDNGSLCGFCSHEASSHRVMPLPSWFRDQYDTYIVSQDSARERSHSSSEDEGNNDSDGETSRHYLTAAECGDDEDEETVLENSRGRLDVALLRRVTAIRYDDLLQANGLTVGGQALDPETISARSDREDGDNRRPTWNSSTEIEYITTDSSRTIEEEEASQGAEDGGGLLQRDADKGVGLNGSSSRRRDARTKVTDCPWWLRPELAMVHSPRCLCQKAAFVVSPVQLAHVAVCRWLRHTAIKVHRQQQQQHAARIRALGSSCSTESPIVALASVQPAFEHWRDVARLDARESAASEAVARPPTRVLRSVLFQWRHGKEFLAFQRWKNHQTSVEVAHQRLATRLEQVVADMRRNRFATLRLRQQQLQDSTRGLMVPSP